MTCNPQRSSRTALDLGPCFDTTSPSRRDVPAGASSYMWETIALSIGRDVFRGMPGHPGSRQGSLFLGVAHSISPASLWRASNGSKLHGVKVGGQLAANSQTS
mmetsp:Transcript_1549/g.9539  ORF Transcript_1549/g.9539 Transcript_1549/m.9539 type:complete len:103 (-) Transcript_1549:1228-1536(-)